jgi:heme oxygenase
MRFSRQYRALLIVGWCQISAITAFSVNKRAFGMGARTFRTPVIDVLSMTPPPQSTSTTAAPPVETSFIDSELRGAAMKLHTKSQAPREGQAAEPSPKPPQHTTTHADYLQFLVDSKHVYEKMEDIVNQHDELAMFRNTGLERTKALELDIAFMTTFYNLQRPSVGEFGVSYANALQQMEIPAFLCHYYNWYFAHTAGGRMIGKQISKLLLDGKTLEFYKVKTKERGACR